MHVAVYVARVITPKLKSHLPCKSSSVNTSQAIDLTVNKGMNASISNACAYVSYQALFSSISIDSPGYDTY